MLIPDAFYGGVIAFVQTLELKFHRLLSDLSDRKKVYTKLTVMCYHIVFKIRNTQVCRNHDKTAKYCSC